MSGLVPIGFDQAQTKGDKGLQKAQNRAALVPDMPDVTTLSLCNNRHVSA